MAIDVSTALTAVYTAPKMRRILLSRSRLKYLIHEEQAHCDAVAMRYIQSLQDELDTMMAPSERKKAKEELIPEVTRCGALVVRNESRAVGNVEDFVHYITPEDLFRVPHPPLLDHIKEAKETHERICSHQISMTARLLEVQQRSAQNLNRSAVLLTLLLATAFLLGGLNALPPPSQANLGINAKFAMFF
jgi:energy-coupling factor transporter transmembrane protein EcfT